MSKHVEKQLASETLIESTDEAWDNRELGCSEAHVKVSDDLLEMEINDALELHPISIRLNKSLIEDLKMIADLHGLGYQPLIRQILTRFADCEKKRILQEVHSKEVKKPRRSSKHKEAA
ncbi:hypothetical protein [Pantoea ananatis]|uniref:hypothetical protein n=1 Tax=Pantoea ananas TaxID=553 RepID=UPI001F4DAAED|nr:hypothetical protein [Pantoea ananatis]MCH9269041.1 hypothetical protein [Pantoea ananatis]